MVQGVRIKDHWSEQRIFDQRTLAAGVIIVTLTLILISRLFLLQVIRHDYYAELSQGNRARIEPIPAARGLILDRNGEVIAANQPAYQLELVPEEVPDLEKTLSELAALGFVPNEDLDEVRRSIRSRRAFDSVPLRLRLSEEDIARFAVRRFEFPGVDIKTRQTRWYPNNELAVHALGYVAAISEQDFQRIDRAAYSGTTLIGKLGVESAYEAQLHGTNGFREVLVNAQGRSVQRQGALTPDMRVKAPTAGADLMLTIDMPTQRVAEEALVDKRGSVVAIDPQSGDIIALVSRPGFDPNLFGRGLTRAEFAGLNDNIDRPLFNRALRGMYPSGSTIKPAIALAGLVFNEVNPDATRFCGGVYRLPGSSRQFREGRTGRHGAMNLRSAIAKSCDVYFYDLANTLGVDHIAAFLAPLGFGRITGIDISGEKPGLLPSREWKKKAFARPADQMWFPGETVNFGIGQGYFLTTPLQLAHYVSILANKGKSFKPRLVNARRDPVTGAVRHLPPVLTEEIKSATPEQWNLIHEAMVGTLVYGTAASTAGKNMTYTIAGKTGTAQVFTVGQNEKLDNQKTVSDRLRDHAWFIAFAPAEAPRIAVAVLVENGGFGSAAASPIARKVMDTFLLNAQGQLKQPLPPGTPLMYTPKQKALPGTPPASPAATKAPADTATEPAD
ncbi:MAG: penicillin-binding protein 2 [Gammaproteobacteria bacterium]